MPPVEVPPEGGCFMCGRTGAGYQLGREGGKDERLAAVWLCYDCSLGTNWWLINHAVTPAEARAINPERCKGLTRKEVGLMMLLDHAKAVRANRVRRHGLRLGVYALQTQTE
jgi:hypothetical protein